MTCVNIRVIDPGAQYDATRVNFFFGSQPHSSFKFCTRYLYPLIQNFFYNKYSAYCAIFWCPIYHFWDSLLVLMYALLLLMFHSFFFCGGFPFMQNDYCGCKASTNVSLLVLKMFMVSSDVWCCHCGLKYKKVQFW